MKSRINPQSEQESQFAHYSKIIGIEEPLYIYKIETVEKADEVHIYVDFRKGAKFTCPACGADNCSVNQTEDKVWQTLPIIQYDCYIHFRTPYIKCTCGTKIYRPHWENGSSKFTVYFENKVIGLAHGGLPATRIGEHFGLHDTQIRRIINRYVNAEYEKLNWSNVKRLAVDEIYLGKRNKYQTVFTDIDSGKVLFITNGKDGKTFRRFIDEARKHGLTPKKITDISMDMSGAFIAAAGKYFPKAGITFDKFHVIKLLNKAINEVRKAEKEHKDCMYELYKRKDNLTPKQASKLREILALNDRIAQAYAFKESFADIMSYDLTIKQAEALFEQWTDEVWASDLEPLKTFVKTVMKHWYGIVQYFKSRITNGIAEGVNSLIRTIQAVANGFANVQHLRSIVYLRKAFD
jgi:transposase